MEAVKASRGSIVLAGLAFALAAAAVWASIALAAGGSGTSGPAPGAPTSGQIAYGDGSQIQDDSPAPRGDGDCPEKDGEDGSSDTATSSV